VNEGAQAALTKTMATVEEEEAETIAAIDNGGTNDGAEDPDANKDGGEGNGDRDGNGDGDGDGKIHRKEEGNLKFIFIENR